MNYTGATMNEYNKHDNRGGAHTHSLAHRPAGGASSSRATGSRFAPLQNPNQNEAWEQISDDQRAEINDCFQLFDMDKNDHIDFSEFRYALQALGFSNMPRATLVDTFKTRSIPRAGWTPLPAMANQPPPPQVPGVVDLRLPREGFQGCAAELIARRDPREELLKTFNLFDKDGKGLITMEDLRLVVKELGEDVPDQELRSMIEQFDVEDKGGVGREEFLNIFLSG